MGVSIAWIYRYFAPVVCPMSTANGVMFQSFSWTPSSDGSFWDELGGRAQELADAGFTAVWLPPPCKGQGGDQDVGYGIYDLYDLGEFDQKGSVRTRYGTKKQLLGAVAKLKEAGLISLADIVLNHRMGADETETFLAVKVNADHRTEVTSEPFELDAWTRFTFEGRGGKYSEFGWRWHHFTAVDTPAHHKAEAGVIYRVSHKDFADDVGQEMSNYDFLMGCDVNLTQDDVREELLRWGDWFLEETGIDGFRVDAAKHMSAAFIHEFLTKLREDRGQEIFSVCEYAIDNVMAIQDFLVQTDNATHCFDFPLHFRFIEAGKASPGYDLRTIFDSTLTLEVPLQSVSFVDNHDTEPAQGASEGVAEWFKPLAYALILLRKDGFPCVFVGDYDGREQVDGEGKDDPPAVPGLASHRGVIDQLIDLRRRYGFGDQSDFFEEANRIGWVRHGDEDHPGAMVVVIDNNDGGELTIDTGRPGTEFKSVGPAETEGVTTDDEGRAVFYCPGGGVAVYVTG